MPKNRKIDRAKVKAADKLDGRLRIRVMLLERGHSIASWSRSRGIAHEEQTNMMLSGARAYPEIRDLLCKDLGLTRSEFDVIVPLPKEP
jgi:hypothetical protein